MRTAKLPSDKDFQSLIASFERVSSISNSVRREFEIAWIAPYHGLPRSEVRRLYRLWIVDRASGGGGAE
ncbi:MAG: hypothetical protein HC769_31510 [Cyanobacteria bacterium CRU_2_1]|nr:hypothetical protein [Cyanobacteria bacterium CRU_2_1]